MYLLNVSKAGVFAKTPKTQERKLAAKESHDWPKVLIIQTHPFWTIFFIKKNTRNIVVKTQVCCQMQSSDTSLRVRYGTGSMK